MLRAANVNTMITNEPKKRSANYASISHFECFCSAQRCVRNSIWTKSKLIRSNQIGSSLHLKIIDFCSHFVRAEIKLNNIIIYIRAMFSSLNVQQKNSISIFRFCSVHECSCGSFSVLRFVCLPFVSLDCMWDEKDMGEKKLNKTEIVQKKTTNVCYVTAHGHKYS